jgi:tetratricopeptide (TPR) repeat protein
MKYLLLTFLMLCSFISSGQNFYSEFKQLYKKDYDAKKIEKLLKDWEKKEPKNVDLFISGFNYYLNESSKEVLHLSTTPGNGEQLELKDSLNKTAGYIYSGGKATIDSLFEVSQNYLIKGIKLYPKRLDLRFGKIYALGTVERFDVFTKEILDALDYSKTINHKWIWSENKPLQDEIIFIKSSVQDYQNTLYQNKQDENMKKIAVKMNAVFPNDAIILSTLGSCYLMADDFKGALPIFLQANSIDANDTIILNNIAFTYQKLNDKTNAKKYYQIMYDKGDDEVKADAKNKMEKLN